MVIFCFEASKDIFAYDNGIPKPASHDASVHRGLVIPACMRKELMSLAHATHIDIEGCLRRVRECFFWRRIASDVKENVFEWDV